MTSSERPDTTPQQSWLRLLVDEKPAADFEHYRLHLLRTGAESDHAFVDDEADRASRLRQRLAERQRQAGETAVLNDLARRLATLRGSADVLQEVTEQARRLLRADVAYIMLLREDSRLRIEFADGSMGAVLRGIELPAGVGLGGHVFRTGRPVRSRHYLTDHAYPHLESVDAAAISEQLGGILGVPLVLGEDVIGVLLAADRRPKSFTDREVELLAALAAHAAVAIHNASLFEQNRRAVAELQAANAALQHTNDIQQQTSELRERLTSIVIGGGGVADIAGVLERAVGASVQVYGAQHEHLGGGSGPVASQALVGQQVLRELEAGGGPVTAGAVTGPSGTVVIAPVRLRSGYAGCLVAPSGEHLKEDEVARLLSIGSTAVALVISSERSAAEAELRLRGEFVTALLSPDVDEASIRRRARSAGLDIDSVSTVAVFDSGQEEADAGGTPARLTSELGGWWVARGDHVVALLPGVTTAEVKSRLARMSDSGWCGAVGLAGCAGGSRAVRTSYDVARQTATVLLALGRRQAVADAVELGVYRSLFSQAGRGELTSYIEHVVGPVLAYDENRERQLALTLLTYLGHSQHHAKTCSALHIHANTLYARLDRIRKLLGDDWREPSRALDIQLALRLDSLRLSLTDWEGPA